MEESAELFREIGDRAMLATAIAVELASLIAIEHCLLPSCSASVGFAQHLVNYSATSLRGNP